MLKLENSFCSLLECWLIAEVVCLFCAFWFRFFLHEHKTETSVAVDVDVDVEVDGAPGREVMVVDNAMRACIADGMAHEKDGL